MKKINDILITLPVIFFIFISSGNSFGAGGGGAIGNAGFPLFGIMQEKPE